MSRPTHVQNLQYMQSIISNAAAAVPISRSNPRYDFYRPSQTGHVLFPNTSVRNSLCTLRPADSHCMPFQQQDFHSEQPVDPLLWLLSEQRPEVTLVHPSIPKRRRTSLAPSAQVADSYHPLLCGIPRAHTSHTRDQRFLCGRSLASSALVNRSAAVQVVHPNGRSGRRICYLNNSGGLRHSYASSSSSSIAGLSSSEVLPPSSATLGSTPSGRGSSYNYPIHVPKRRKRPCFARRFKCPHYVNSTEFPCQNVSREDNDRSAARIPSPNIGEPQLRGYKNAPVFHRQQASFPLRRNSQHASFLDTSERNQVNASFGEPTSRLTDAITTLSGGAQSICNSVFATHSMHETNCEQTVVSSSVSAVLGYSEAPTLSTVGCRSYRNVTSLSPKTSVSQSRSTGSLSSSTRTNERGARSSHLAPFSEPTDGTDVDENFSSGLVGPPTNSSEAVVAAVASAAQAVANAVSAVVIHHRRLSNGVYGLGEPLVMNPLESDLFPAHAQGTFASAQTETGTQVSTESRLVLPNVSEEQASAATAGRWMSGHSLPACFPAPLDSHLSSAESSVSGHSTVRTLSNQSVFGSIAASTTEAIQATPPLVDTTEIRCQNPCCCCCSLPSRSVSGPSLHSISCCPPYTTVQSIQPDHPPPASFTLVPSAFSAVDILAASNSYAAVTSPSFAFPTVPNMPLNFSAVPRPSQANFLPISAQMAGALNLTPMPHLAPVRLGSTEHNVMRNLTQPQPIGHPPTTLRHFLGPQLSFCTQLSPVSILPVQNFPVTSYTDTLSATRDAQTLFQFLRLMNQRQEAYSLPYYPSAMTATAGGSNMSVVVSASLGGTNGSRVAAAVTPPLVPHHSIFPPPPQAAVISHSQLPPPFSLPTGLLAHSTRGISPPTTSVQPVSSAAMALAAVAVAAAAALHQQQNMRHFSATAVSALTNPPAAPTPSIPVPILHAQLYYPATVPVSHVSPPCYHSHYGAHSASQRHVSVVSPDVLTTPATASSSAAYWTQLVPLLLALPTTSSSADHPVQAPYAAGHAVPVGNAFAAVAAAAAAAAASVDTLYQLAVHLESGSTGLNRGLSTEELASLPVRIHQSKPDPSSQTDENADRTGDRCMICLDDYVDADKLRQMRCRHEFHVDCVDKWLKTKRTCPLCRADAFDGSQRKDDFL